MALLERLTGIDDDQIPVHTFWAALDELSDGEVTQGQIESFFSLNASDVADLDWIIAKYTGQPNAAAKARFVEKMHTLFILATSSVPGYTTRAEMASRINRI